MEQNTKIAQNKKKVITKYMKGNYVSEGLLQFFWDSVACITIACQTSVLIMCEKITQETPIKNENNLRTWKCKSKM